MSNLLRPIGASFVLMLMWCCVAGAQQPVASTPDAGGNATATERRIEESKPSIFYLPDKRGELQPVLDFKYQDFVDLYNLKNRLQRRDEPPKYVLQKIDVAGTAGKQFAELTIRIEILLRDDDWIRIPLRLDEALLRGAMKYAGGGSKFLQYESDGGGYVCWLRGKAESQHEITLSVLVPLVSTGDETRLKLFVPHAAESQLTLTVPMPKAVGQISEGATLLPTEESKGNTTDLRAIGLGGEVELMWQKAGVPTVDAPLVFESSAVVRAKLDSQSITSEATLQVRSHGAPFEHFTVRLPPGAELTPGSPGAYVITPLDAAAKLSGERRAVEVRLPKKTVGPVEVRIACRRECDLLKTQDWRELAGFEVVGAVRQSGTIVVSAGSTWQTLWGPSSDVRSTAPLPDQLRTDGVVAAFEYAAQPYSLTVRLAPRKTRVRVTPEYMLLVGRDEMRLEGRLGYTIVGPKLATLEVSIPGWELDGVGPDDVVSADGVIVNGSDVIVPLVGPTSGRVELQVRAHRPIKAGTKSLIVPMPLPKCDAALPMSLTVVAADNVDLNPDVPNIKGLLRQESPPTGTYTQRQQIPLFYRGTSGAAEFAAGFQVHRQQIQVDVASQVTLGARAAEVEQKQSYTIAYEPADRLTIALPRVLAVQRRIQILCDGKPLLPVPAAVAPTGSVDSSRYFAVVLPSPRIGRCELVISYSVPLTAPTLKQTTTLALPLPMPRDGRLTANTLSVKSAGNIRATAGSGLWIAASDNGESGALRLVADRVTDHAELDLAWQADETRDAVIIDRAWVQSWLTSQERQDRAVFQLTTRLKELDVILPSEAQMDANGVLVNGKLTGVRAVSDHRLLVPLVAPASGRAYVIELQYHFPGRPQRGALSLELPRIAKAWSRRFYWQLVLPTNEHLIGNPAGFTSEFAWTWQGCFWERQPLLNQTDLEAWAGATYLSAIPEQENVYLFSTLGSPRAAEIRTASRTWIVLWASGAALVAGLVLIYLPVVRHPATLLAACIGIVAAGFVAPEPTLLFAQAASLGLVLALLAGLFERRVVARHRRFVPRAESPSRLAELGSTRTPPVQPLSGALTEAMPVVTPQSHGNGE